MNWRVSLALAVALLCSCSRPADPHVQPASSAGVSSSAAASASPPSAPLGTGAEHASRRSAHVRALELHEQHGSCAWNGSKPVVESGNTAVDQWIATVIQESYEQLADLHPCAGEPLDFGFRVLYDEHDVLQLQCDGPPSTLNGWTFPSNLAFDLRTGEELTAEKLFEPAADAELQTRYRAAWRAFRPKANPACKKEGYRAELDSFVFHAEGIAFDDLANVPMHMRVCLGASVTMPYDKARSWMTPAFASRFGPSP